LPLPPLDVDTVDTVVPEVPVLVDLVVVVAVVPEVLVLVDLVVVVPEVPVLVDLVVPVDLLLPLLLEDLQLLLVHLDLDLDLQLFFVHLDLDLLGLLVLVSTLPDVPESVSVSSPLLPNLPYNPRLYLP